MKTITKLLLALSAIVCCWNCTKVETEPEPEPVPDPVIVTEVESLELSGNLTHDNIINVWVQHPVENEVLSVETDAKWITDLVYSSSKHHISFSATENMQSANRSATLKLSYPGAADVEVEIVQGCIIPEIILESDKVEVPINGLKTKVPFTIKNKRENSKGKVTVSFKDYWLTVTIDGDCIVIDCPKNETHNFRTDQITVSYPDAEDVVISVFQEGPPRPVIQIDRQITLSYSEDYRGTISIKNGYDDVEPVFTYDIPWIDTIMQKYGYLLISPQFNNTQEERTAQFTVSYENAEDVVVTVTQPHAPYMKLENTTFNAPAEGQMLYLHYTIPGAVDNGKPSLFSDAGHWVGRTLEADPEGHSGRITLVVPSNPTTKDRTTKLRVSVPHNPYDSEIVINQSGRSRGSFKNETREIVVDNVRFKMIPVPANTFEMGTDKPIYRSENHAQPKHRVTLSDYYIGQYEVTQALWEAVMGKGSVKCDKKGPNKPIYDISWYQAQEFITKLNKKTGLFFALPSEAQWEYAARGGERSAGYRYSGSNDPFEIGWIAHSKNNSVGIHDVGLLKSNEIGIYDMIGNALEWCWDADARYTNAAVTDPYVIDGTEDHPQINPLARCIRGGDHEATKEYATVFSRLAHVASYDMWNFGFRLVLLP